VTAIGCLGLLVTTVGLVGRWPTVLTLGLAAVGACYAVFLSLRGGTVDPRAPLFAAIFFVAAELAFWSIERRLWRSESAVIIRRLALVLAAGLATSIAGGLLLLLASGRRAGSGYEAAGVVAAVLMLAVIAVLVRRSLKLRLERA
jgi:hypothetical protein